MKNKRSLKDEKEYLKTFKNIDIKKVE